MAADVFMLLMIVAIFIAAAMAASLGVPLLDEHARDSGPVVELPARRSAVDQGCEGVAGLGVPDAFGAWPRS
jgi:hypothetical protein